MNIINIMGAEGKCYLCGKVTEVRPYGKDGATVCFDCAKKDMEETDRQFRKLTDGADIIIIGGHSE